MGPGIIDHRSLGLFRISFGSLLVLHAFTHLRFYRDLYAPDGVLPSALLPMATEIPYFASILSIVENHPWGLSLFILLATTSYVSFLIGWQTKLATLGSLLAFSSLCHRNPYLVIGADELIGSMLLWSCLVPLDACFSLDSRRKSSGARSPAAANSQIAQLGMLLQLSMVYFATAWQKSGRSWSLDGTALEMVLGMSVYRLPGAAFVECLPISVLRSLSRCILFLEYALPFLILAPVARPQLRRMAIIVIAGLHLGIAFVVDTGLYSMTMFAMLPLMMTAEDWRLIVDRSWLKSRQSKTSIANPDQVKSKFRFASLAELAAVVLMIGFAQENWHRNFAGPPEIAARSVFTLPWRFAAAAQRWWMFAPDPPQNDVHLDVYFKSLHETEQLAWTNHSTPMVNGQFDEGHQGFLWKVYMQRIATMQSSERYHEGERLRTAVCRYFANLASRTTERSQGSADPDLAAVELWVTLIPIGVLSSSQTAMESTCVLRYECVPHDLERR